MLAQRSRLDRLIKNLARHRRRETPRHNRGGGEPPPFLPIGAHAIVENATATPLPIFARSSYLRDLISKQKRSYPCENNNYKDKIFERMRYRNKPRKGKNNHEDELSPQANYLTLIELAIFNLCHL